MAKVKRKQSKRSIFNAKVAIAHEPTLHKNSTDLEIMGVFNWYNANFEYEDAKTFLISFLKQRKFHSDKIKRVQQMYAVDLLSLGWFSRILSNGYEIPEKFVSIMNDKLENIFRNPLKEEVSDVDEVVPSVHERIENKASEYIAELESLFDDFYKTGSTFNAADWFRQYAIKPPVAKLISDFYTPLYEEVTEILNGEDQDLKAAYKSWKRPDLKKYHELVKSVISAAATCSVVAQATRKPRSKKEKPAAQQVKKLQYQEKTETGLVSVSPATIIGANQLWTFNTKNRTLSVFNAIGPAGLSVKGTTLLGFDETTSKAKTLRKPEDVCRRVLEGGKLVLRKVFDEVKTTEQKVSGRINTQTILLRVVK